MSKKKRKGKQAQPVVMPKTEAERNRMVIKIDPLKVAIGHQSHGSGAGIHGDRRTKRHRTRAAAKRRALGDW